VLALARNYFKGHAMKKILLGFVMIAAIALTCPIHSFADQIQNPHLNKAMINELKVNCVSVGEDIAGNIYAANCLDKGVHFGFVYLHEKDLLMFRQEEELSDELIDYARGSHLEIPSLFVLDDNKSYSISLSDLTRIEILLRQKRLDMPRQKYKESRENL
jgi:hypothetical protein